MRRLGKRGWRRRDVPAALAGTLAALCVIAGLAGATYSAFASKASNTGSTFTAAASFTGCAYASGTTPTALTSAADAFVMGSDNGTSYAGQTFNGSYMRIRAIDDPIYSDTHIFVRFDLSSLAGCAISSAKLSLTAFNDTSGNGGPGTGHESTSDRVVDAYRSSAAWSESTLSWNTWTSMPNGGRAGTAAALTTPQAAGQSSGTSAPAVHQWTVTDHVNAMIAGDNFGFFLRDRSGTSSNGNEGANQWYRTREYGTADARPQLQVTIGSDTTAPSIAAATVVKSSGGTAGTIRQGGDYHAYADVTDAVGVASVTADLSSFDSGQGAAALSSSGGPWTVGGQTYSHRSALLSADSPLSTGTTYPYSVSAVDVSGNSARGDYVATVEDYATVVKATSGLVSYWRLGETSGTTAADSKSANTGAYLGGATLGASGALVGDSNRAANFDGVDDRVRVPDSASLDVTGAITLEAWVKLETVKPSWQGIVTKGYYGWWLSRHDSIATPAYFHTSDAGNGHAGVKSISDNQWHHVVATWNGAGTKRLYVDGVLDREITGIGGGIVTNTDALNIGYHDQILDSWWDGSIDEVAVYNSALTAAQALDHYKLGKGTG